ARGHIHVAGRHEPIAVVDALILDRGASERAVQPLRPAAFFEQPSAVAVVVTEQSAHLVLVDHGTNEGAAPRVGTNVAVAELIERAAGRASPRADARPRSSRGAGAALRHRR